MSSLALDFAPSARHRRRARFDWRFLALAALLHAGLLSLPVLRDTPGVAPGREIELWLLASPEREPETKTPVSEPLETPVESPVVTDERSAPPATTTDTSEEPVPDPASTPDARQLLDGIGRLEWQDPAPGPRPIARIHDERVYGRLSKPLLPEFENLFNGLVLPATATVVDRWLEPGGVHRVVVRLPNGTTLCGRQEPVNDFRPWEQMPMMFGACGGGGRR